MTKCDMPSGKDYGRVLRWGWIDNKEFIVSVSYKDNEYNWVVEYKDGTQVLIDNHTPLHNPVFGIDEGDWMDWVNSTYERIDAWLESKAQAGLG